MRNTRTLAILVLALGLMVRSAPMAEGAQSLTVNGQRVRSITLELGQSCTVEVVSDDGKSYEAYVGFDNGVVLGDFSHYQTAREAGDNATVTEFEKHAFYGYYVRADGVRRAPSAGVHFVFEYEAQEVGETDLKLYADDPLPSAGKLLDSVPITVIPAPMGAAITYQGRLLDEGSPADGLYGFEFRLYRAPNGGIQEGNTIDINDLDVIDGYFTVELDFGSDPNIFNGYARWLQIGVRPGDSTDPNAFVTLSPRQELTPTPYALYAETAGGEGNDWVVSGNDMYAIPSGNVGIGTTSPLAKLHVEEPGSAEPLRVGVTGSTKLIVKNDGKVGIGTGSPDEKLEVVGTIKADKIVGQSWAEGGVGVNGAAINIDGVGVSAGSLFGTGLIARTYNDEAYAAEFFGNVLIRNVLTEDPVVELGGGNYAGHFSGDVRVDGNLMIYSGSSLVLELGTGLDYAEGFDVSESTKIDAGSVLIIDAENPGKLAISDKPYDSKVAGIVAGAKGIGSGVRLGAGQFDYDVGLAGRVYCNVDATEAGVEPGDLLTTSATPGYAMKATDYARAQGAILGKAMEKLEIGKKGQILVLVTLQ